MFSIRWTRASFVTLSAPCRWSTGRCHRHSSGKLFLSTTDDPVSENTQRVALIGAGAVGGYYGARLWEAGHKVQFHMRGDNLQATKTGGFSVASDLGNVMIPANEIEVFQRTDQMDPPDWIVVALKSTSLHSIPELVEPLLHPNVRILVIMNGMVEEDLIKFLKRQVGERDHNTPLECCRALYGGVAYIASNRIAPGRVEHLAASGLLTIGVASTLSETPGEDSQAVKDLWGNTKVPLKFIDSLLRGRWEKNVWNLPFNGISVALGGITTDHIVNDPALRELAREIMNETVLIANADLERSYGHGKYHPIKDEYKEHMMDITDTMGAYKTSTMLDLVNRKAMEVKYLFGKPLDRAKELGIPAPHLATVVAQVSYFQRRHNLF